MITIKDVEHVAKLARLDLTQEEKEMFTHQLGDVLAHVEKCAIYVCFIQIKIFGNLISRKFSISFSFLYVAEHVL